MGAYFLCPGQGVGRGVRWVRAAPGVITEGGDKMAKICAESVWIRKGRGCFFPAGVTRNFPHRVPPDLATPTLLHHWPRGTVVSQKELQTIVQYLL